MNRCAAMIQRRRLALGWGLLGLLVAIGCNTVAPDGAGTPSPATPVPPRATPTITPLPPPATPTVDLAPARAAFQAGGELTYAEVLALQHALVGDPPDVRKYKGASDKYYQDQNAFWDREQAFAAQLAHCRLQATDGWVAWWAQERDQAYHPIPDKNRLAVYLVNPFAGAGKELRDGPEMFLVYFTDRQVAEFRYGQRLQFSGALLQVDGQLAVTNPRYAVVADDPPTPTPTADELQDLRITLARSMCFGFCPDYTLTVAADGTVTFEGRDYTRVKGTVTGHVDRTQLTELASAIKQADFFGLEDSYSTNVTDNPSYTLTVQMGGRSKQVESYATRPRRLALLMDRIDQITDSQQWIHTASAP